MTVMVLGPQRERPDVGDEVARLRGGAGPVALITAGWQEWEDDDAWLHGLIGGSVVNLELYRRAETIWRDDPELASAHHQLQARIRLLRRSYNARLERLMEAWIALERMAGEAAVLQIERAAACDDVRALDRHHLARIGSLRREFDERWRPGDREAVARERAAVVERLQGAAVVVIAGGHVPLLLNRLRLFGLRSLLTARPLVAWSGGAMALAERVVLFHDSPPWGPGHAEVGEMGLGVVAGLVALPDARHRLRLDDPERVGRMARRFEPDICLLLDEGARAEWADGRWRTGDARRLSPEGGVAEGACP